MCKPILLVALLYVLSASALSDVCPLGQRSAGPRPTPLSQIQNLSGRQFDSAYMRAMYQHHSDTSALASLELQYSNDTSLKELADKIQHERSDLNAKLAQWYRASFGGSLSESCLPPPTVLMSFRGLASAKFDNEFVRLMIDYIQQAKDAAQLALVKAVSVDLRQQSKIVVRSADLEIAALRRWQNNLPMFD